MVDFGIDMRLDNGGLAKEFGVCWRGRRELGEFFVDVRYAFIVYSKEENGEQRGSHVGQFAGVW